MLIVLFRDQVNHCFVAGSVQKGRGFSGFVLHEGEKNSVNRVFRNVDRSAFDAI